MSLYVVDSSVVVKWYVPEVFPHQRSPGRAAARFHLELA
jgi:hypothetical protein